LVRDAGRRELAVRVVKVVNRQPDLFQVVLALGSRSSFPDLLNGRKQQANEDGNDRNDDEQLNQRKGMPPITGTMTRMTH
jgi:hypothetical protein